MIYNNLTTFNYGFESRIHFEGYSKVNDTNPVTKKPGVRIHDWFTAFVLRILGLEHLITELKTDTGVIYLNRNSFDKWRKRQAKELNMPYDKTHLPTAEKIISWHKTNLNPPGLIDIFPTELIKIILTQPGFSIYDRLQLREVKKSWHTILNTELESEGVLFDKEKKFMEPHVKIYGKTAWEKYYGYKIEGDIPPIPHNIVEITRKLRTLLKKKGTLLTCSLILMPKGLSLNKLRTLIENPIAGQKSQFCKLEFGATPNKIYKPKKYNVFSSLGDVPTKKSYWFFMTNDIVKKVNVRSINNDLAIGLDGYKKPSVLEVAVSCFMNQTWG